MSLAIVCHNQAIDLTQSTLVQLDVRSQNLDWIDRPQLPKQISQSDDHRGDPSKRPRVVRFTKATVQTHLKGRRSSTFFTAQKSSNYGSYDLTSSKDICKELTSQPSTTCLGHIDIQSDESFRHSFYTAKRSLRSSTLAPSSSSYTALSMDEVLDDSSMEFFSTIYRLKLARSLVSAVLKFHSTPWLSEFWRLKDLSFFKTDHSQEISEALQTLHLGFELAQNQLNSMEGVQNSSSASQVSEDDRLLCGIDNLTLHSLGVALLQIDRWARVEPGDILKVRKMALRTSSLGPRYQDITQKCLRCDFGYGSDLTKPRLQEAVYKNTVGMLEEMISSLDLTGD